MSERSMKLVKFSLAIGFLLGAGFLLSVRFFPSIFPGGSWQRISALKDAKLSVLSSLEFDSRTWLIAGVSFKLKESVIMISTDGGETWRQGGEELRACDEITDIEADPERAGHIFVSAFNTNQDNSGIYLSTDYGLTWNSINAGLPSHDIRTVRKIGNRVYVGAVNAGVFYTEDYGATWHEQNTGLTNLYIQSICAAPTNPQRLLCGTLEGLFISTDGGEHWTTPPHEMSTEFPFVLEIVADSHHADRFYALHRTGGVRTDFYRSDDAGNHWYPQMTGVPEEFHPRCILVDSYIPDQLYLGTVYDGVYVSKDAGALWKPLNQGIPLDTPMVFHSVVHGFKDQPYVYGATNVANMVFKREGSYRPLARFVNFMSSF